MKTLVTDIKFSGFFEDQRIFEALQFKVAKEVLNKFEVEQSSRFQYRGLKTVFDLRHPSITVTENVNPMTLNQLNKSLSLGRLVQDDLQTRYLCSLMSEPLPLHGIHYWEFRVGTSN